MAELVACRAIQEGVQMRVISDYPKDKNLVPIHYCPHCFMLKDIHVSLCIFCSIE